MNVLVIGDCCEDVFIYGDIERISPEAPIPVFVFEKYYSESKSVMFLIFVLERVLSYDLVCVGSIVVMRFFCF